MSEKPSRLTLSSRADLFGLAGGTPEQVPDVYRDRSPINRARDISSPLYVLQGDEDMIVPKAQAEAIVDAVRANGVRCDYSLFAGEGHGWRRAETIVESAKKTLAFLVDVLQLDVGAKAA